MVNLNLWGSSSKYACHRERLMVRGCVLAVLVTIGFTDFPRAQTAPSETRHSRPAPFTVSKETTRITKPLMEDGRVDYFRAFDNLLKSGVTVENNAGVLIAQAFGPEIVPEDQRTNFFENLGIQVPPIDGTYFVSCEQHLAQRVSDEQAKEHIANQGRYAHEPWTRERDAELYAWIARNETAINLIQEASWKEMLYFPPVALPSKPRAQVKMIVQMKLSGIDKMRDITRALAVRAMLRLGEGNLEAAHLDLMTIHRLARLVARYPLLIPRLVSYGMNSMACEAEVAVAQHGTRTSTQALQFREAVEELPPFPDLVAATDVGERYQYLEVAQDAAYQGLDVLGAILGKELPLMDAWERMAKRSGIDYDIVLRIGNEFFDVAVAALRETNLQRQSALIKELDDKFEEMRGYGKPELIREMERAGKLRQHVSKMVAGILLPMLRPSLVQMSRAQVMAQLNRDLARLAYALTAYKIDHSSYPETIDQLVPNYIADVPADPFADAPLHYSAHGERYLVYSVGFNGVDDHGATEESQTPGDDIVIEVNRVTDSSPLDDKE